MRIVLAQPYLDGLGTPKPTKAAKRRKPQKVAGPPVQPRYESTVDEHGRRVWTLAFPAPAELISVNGNPPWRRTYAARKALREAMAVYARQARLPVGLSRIRFDVELRFPTASRRDGPNYHGHVAKPLVDAVGPAINTMRGGKPVQALGHGLIPDDTARYLDGPHIVIGPTCADRLRTPYGEITVTITDLSGEVAA